MRGLEPANHGSHASGDQGDHMRASILGCVLALSIAGAPVPHARAEGTDYPVKAVTFIVPFPAGGRTDVIGRIVAQGLTKKLGKPVAVVNKPGASSVLGAREVADAGP